MINDYESYERFVEASILDPGLEFNHVKTTTSAIRRILKRFEENQWAWEKIEDEKANHPKHRITSPDGQMSLSMVSAMVARHPFHTDQICTQKHLTKRLLEFAGVPTAPGTDFSLREHNVARAYFRTVPKPVVVKPSNSGGSQGVTVGVRNEEDFMVAWRHAAEVGGKHASILVEQFVRGIELRAFVIGDQAVSIVARIQPFVVGDGNKTLEQLIDSAAEARQAHYRARQMPIIPDWAWLERHGFEPTTVPEPDQIVMVNPFALAASGALLVDVSETVHPDIKSLAVKAIDAVPDLEVGGVDILIEDLKSPNGAIVLEVNSAPSVNLHRYTTHGPSRDVDIEVADYFHQKYLEEL